jgi:long-chain acyl-CoA synthetase
MRCDDF